MREEEAWRHIQEQDVDNEEEEDQETVPKDRLELSRKRPQESIDEQKENNGDQRRPIRTRRQEKRPSKPTESQQESASNSKGGRKRPHLDTAEMVYTNNKQHYVEEYPTLHQATHRRPMRLQTRARRRAAMSIPLTSGTKMSRRCRRSLDKGG